MTNELVVKTLGQIAKDQPLAAQLCASSDLYPGTHPDETPQDALGLSEQPPSLIQTLVPHLGTGPFRTRQPFEPMAVALVCNH